MEPRARSYAEVPPDQATLDFLWRVTSFGRDHVPAGSAYWYENMGREPADTVVFQFTVGGELTYRDAAGRHPVPEGSALLFSYDEDTGYGLGADAVQAYRSRFICLRGQGLPAHWRAMRERYGSILTLGRNRTLLAALNQLIDMARPHQAASPSIRASQVYSFVMQVFDQLRAIHTHDLSPVNRAIAALRDNPFAPWSLKEVAATYGVSREHLSRLFQEHTGQSPAAYIRTARLRRALWLIENTRLPITDIARQAGYTSTHTLARQVRHQTGQSPQNLRLRRGH